MDSVDAGNRHTFIVAMNYVLISISAMNRRAKAIGVHKCSGANTGTIFGMFLWGDRSHHAFLAARSAASI